MYQICVNQSGHRWVWSVYKDGTLVTRSSASYSHPTQACDAAIQQLYRTMDIRNVDIAADKAVKNTPYANRPSDPPARKK